MPLLIAKGSLGMRLPPQPPQVVDLERDSSDLEAQAEADFEEPQAGPGRPGLRALHLGIDRPAEKASRFRTAPWSTSSARWRASRAWGGRCPAGGNHAFVRHAGLELFLPLWREGGLYSPPPTRWPTAPGCESCSNPRA